MSALSSNMPIERDLLAAVVLSLTDEILDGLDWENTAALLAEKGCVISGGALQELLIDHILPRLSHEFYPLSDRSGDDDSMKAAASTTPEAHAHGNVVIDLTQSDTEDSEEQVAHSDRKDRDGENDDEVVLIRESFGRSNEEAEHEVEAGGDAKGNAIKTVVMEVLEEV